MTTLLFIQSITSSNWEEIKIKCIPFLVCITCDTIAMVIDLISGIRKAKQRGELRSSEGYKRTVDKALKYYSLLILCFLVDVIASMIVSVPYFTLAAGIGIILIEIKSWYEKADEKDRNDIATIAALVKSKDDIVKAAADQVLINLKNKDNETDN